MVSYFLFSGQVLAHIALAWAVFNFSLTDWCLVLLMYFIGGCLGGTVTFHRLLSHRSWQAPAWWYYMGSLCGMAFLIGSPLAWANNHLAHHRHVDTPKDPHSPHHMSWWRVQWLSMFTADTSLRYGARNINPFQVFLHKHYIALHLLYSFTLYCVGGWYLLAVLYLVPSAVVWNMASLINLVGHIYTPFSYISDTGKVSGRARNNLLLGWCVWGEGFHHNHHAEAANKRFGRKWWEFDVGYWVIRLLEKKHEQA